MNFERNRAEFSINIDFVGGGILVIKLQGFPGHYPLPHRIQWLCLRLHLKPEIYSNPEISGDT